MRRRELLVLSRRKNESILMGEPEAVKYEGGHDIKVTVIEIRGNTVRLGIEAGQEVGITREELLLKAPPTPEGETIELEEAPTIEVG
jgi:carbon storage regulator CsrA